ncbi:hypothetical protein JL722_3727 [Aureococcus anophagefferens]|nr:hypothetical protein JL722_3727 [Aureococcus anophagefferens]
MNSLAAIAVLLALPRVTAQCAPGTVAFSEHVITTLADDGQSVFAVDVDGDGDADILTASNYDDTVAWYENDGPSPSRALTNSANGANFVVAADVDGDADVDVLPPRADNSVTWFENDGSGGFTERSRQRYLRDLRSRRTSTDGTWTSFPERIVTTLADNVYSVYAIDLTVIRGWDPRRRASFEIPAHASPRGAGAASCLARLGDGARLASCGADGRVALSDVRYGKPLLSFDDHADFPTPAVLGTSFTGAGDGALLCHDVPGAGSCEWGLGAGLGAVRCVDARPDQLVAAGDDGNVLLWRL